MKIFYKRMIRFLPQIIFVIITSFLFFQSCKKDKSTTDDAGYSYFPNNIGHYCIYDVDSTVYREFYHDTIHFKYQIKEIIESYFADNIGRPTMRVEQYKKFYIDTIPYDSLPWKISRILAFTRTSSTAEKLEENQRFVRLAFVPRVGKEWNGNGYNAIGEWDYKYLDVDQPYNINNMNFDSTLFVEQKLDTNKLIYRIYRERYARHVGMIEKEVIDVRDTSLCCGSVLNRIYGGVIYSIKLVDWGPR